MRVCSAENEMRGQTGSALLKRRCRFLLNQYYSLFSNRTGPFDHRPSGYTALPGGFSFHRFAIGERWGDFIPQTSSLGIGDGRAQWAQKPGGASGIARSDTCGATMRVPRFNPQIPSLPRAYRSFLSENSIKRKRYEESTQTAFASRQRRFVSFEPKSSPWPLPSPPPRTAGKESAQAPGIRPSRRKRCDDAGFPGLCRQPLLWDSLAPGSLRPGSVL